MTGQLIEQQQTSLIDAPPAERIATAARIADELKRIVDQQQLYTKIGAGKHVHVDGWVLLGNLCGVVPREVALTEDAEGNAFAEVELIRISDGGVVGRASGMCGVDEPTWSTRPRYARRSMAVTRAAGKAFRLSFSWVMTLAGYAPTPAEEMSTDSAAPPTEGRFKQLRGLIDELAIAGDQGGLISLGQELKEIQRSKQLTLPQYNELRNVALAALRKIQAGTEKPEPPETGETPPW